MDRAGFLYHEFARRLPYEPTSCQDGLMRDIAIDQVRSFQDAYLERLRATSQAEVLDPLGEGKLTPEIEKILTETAESVILALK